LNILNHNANNNERGIDFGGAQIFELLFPYTDRMYLTRIDADFEGDTFFPEYDELDWEVKYKSEGVVNENNQYPHTFFVLDRKKQK
jgi:dihydrofolate reductase